MNLSELQTRLVDAGLKIDTLRLTDDITTMGGSVSDITETMVDILLEVYNSERSEISVKSQPITSTHKPVVVAEVKELAPTANLATSTHNTPSITTESTNPSVDATNESLINYFETGSNMAIADFRQFHEGYFLTRSAILSETFKNIDNENKTFVSQLEARRAVHKPLTAEQIQERVNSAFLSVGS